MSAVCSSSDKAFGLSILMIQWDEMLLLMTQPATAVQMINRRIFLCQSLEGHVMSLKEIFNRL